MYIQGDRINLRLTPELLNQVNTLAKTLNVNRSQCIRFLLWRTFPGLPENWVCLSYTNYGCGRPIEYLDTEKLQKRLRKFFRLRRTAGKRHGCMGPK